MFKDAFLLFKNKFVSYKTIIHTFRNIHKEERRRKRRKYK